MKKHKLLTVFILGLLTVLSLVSVKGLNQVNIYFFHDPLCLHCQEEAIFLDEISLEYDNVTLNVIDVTESSENLDFFNEVKSVFSEENVLTPYTVIGGVSLIGFNSQTEVDIENLIIRYSSNEFVDIVDKVLNNQEILISDFDILDRETVNIPLIGEVEMSEFSLLLGAIVIGFVDGFNPCAMWVLILLITLLLNAKNKKRMWYLGVLFLTTSALVYFLIMMSYLTIAVELSTIKWFRYLIGSFAIVFGLYNLNKYRKSLSLDDGCEVVSDKKRLKIIERIKKIIKEDNLILAIIGIIGLALTVNLIELACSAGLPLLYTSILSFHNLSSGAYIGYVLIYVFFFLLDDLIIFTIALLTMNLTGISNRYTKYSHLIGGAIMVLMGALLIFFPNLIMFN